MATINYNGMELEEVTTPQIFDPPKKMLVWNDGLEEVTKHRLVQAIVISKQEKAKVICEDEYGIYRYDHCAEIPEAPKPRRATNRELSRWLAQGNGEYRDTCISSNSCTANFSYATNKGNNHLEPFIEVRKWDDTEWHEPTVDYLFGGDDADR